LIPFGALFVESGLASVTIDAIAERGNLSKGTIYSRFDSKEELFCASAERQIKAWKTHLTAPVPEADFVCWVRVFAERLLSLAITPQCRALAEFIDGVLSSLGTRHRRLVLLMLLDKHAHREMTPTDLAEATGVPPVAISALLDSLEKDGLVGRRPDPVDRCMIRLALTPAGNELLQRVSPTYFEWFTRSVAPVTEDERMQLVRILQKLRHRLMELGARSAPNGAH
jgi:DNA-binding MarR family transcriptional regulator